MPRPASSDRPTSGKKTAGATKTVTAHFGARASRATDGIPRPCLGRRNHHIHHDETAGRAGWRVERDHASGGGIRCRMMLMSGVPDGHERLIPVRTGRKGRQDAMKHDRADHTGREISS